VLRPSVCQVDAIAREVDWLGARFEHPKQPNHPTGDNITDVEGNPMTQGTQEIFDYVPTILVTTITSGKPVTSANLLVFTVCIMHLHTTMPPCPTAHLPCNLPFR
jgi:hypothetical protein